MAQGDGPGRESQDEWTLRLDGFPSQGDPSVTFFLAFAVSETEESRDGCPRDVGRPRWMSLGWMIPRLKMCFFKPLCHVLVDVTV